MQEKHIQYYSNILGRNIDLLIHGDWGYPILMFPTSMGRYYQNKDFGLVESVKNLVDAGKVKIYNVDTIDNLTFYGNDFPAHVKIHNYNQYVRFLHLELVPYIKAECNVERIGVGGASFGGYHAANFAFKHPDQVDYLFWSHRIDLLSRQLTKVLNRELRVFKRTLINKRKCHRFIPYQLKYNLKDIN